MLVEAGANVEARGDEGFTSLHSSAYQGSVEAVLALLKHDAHANAQNNYQAPPLHMTATIAGTRGTVEVVDSLLTTRSSSTTRAKQPRTL